MKLKRFFSTRFIIGILFFINPVIGLYDVLPDCIGYLLLFSALSEIAFLDERLETARRMTLYGAATSGARIALTFFALEINLDDSGVLAAAFLLGAAELFAAVYFAVSYFGGISYIAQRCESDNILGKVDSVKRTWIGFWVLRVVSTVLPEFAALPLLTLQYFPEELPHLNSRLVLLYKNGTAMMLTTLCFFAGIWWLYKMVSFAKGIKKDQKFVASITERYTEFLKANPLQETFMSCRTACVMLCIGCALQINFDVDGRYILPAWLGTVFFGICLHRLGMKKLKSLLPLIAAGAAQLLCVCFPLSGVWKYICPLIIAACGLLTVLFTKKHFTAYVKGALDWDMEGGFMLARIPFAVFLICRAVYGIYPVYWFLLASIISLAVWIFTVIWLCSLLMGEIKKIRRF